MDTLIHVRPAQPNLLLPLAEGPVPVAVGRFFDIRLAPCGKALRRIVSDLIEKLLRLLEILLPVLQQSFLVQLDLPEILELHGEFLRGDVPYLLVLVDRFQDIVLPEVLQGLLVQLDLLDLIVGIETEQFIDLRRMLPSFHFDGIQLSAEEPFSVYSLESRFADDDAGTVLLVD